VYGKQGYFVGLTTILPHFPMPVPILTVPCAAGMKAISYSPAESLSSANPPAPGTAASG
jgi:hypothetical protein